VEEGPLLHTMHTRVKPAAKAKPVHRGSWGELERARERASEQGRRDPARAGDADGADEDAGATRGTHPAALGIAATRATSPAGASPGRVPSRAGPLTWGSANRLRPLLGSGQAAGRLRAAGSRAGDGRESETHGQARDRFPPAAPFNRAPPRLCPDAARALRVAIGDRAPRGPGRAPPTLPPGWGRTAGSSSRGDRRAGH
jgi:hypothetical protein